MQERIEILARKIRERAGDTNQQWVVQLDPTEANLVDEWVAIFLAIETLEDATGALVYYEKFGTGEDLGEKFVRIYGMFQAVILQQQAISRLHEVFVGTTLAVPRDSGWQKITDAFQLSVGSPLEGWRPESAQSKLSQIRITDDGFYIVTWDRDAWDETAGEMAPDRIDPLALLQQYTEEAIAHLQEVCDAMASGTG